MSYGNQARKTAWRMRKLLAGQCTNCGQDHQEDTNLCRKCKDNESRKQKERRINERNRQREQADI